MGTCSATVAKMDTLPVVSGDTAPVLQRTEAETVTALAQRTTRVASVRTGAFLRAEALCATVGARLRTGDWRASCSMTIRP